MAEGIQREVSWGACKAIRSLKPQGKNQVTAEENEKEDFAEGKTARWLEGQRGGGRTRTEKTGEK